MMLLRCRSLWTLGLVQGGQEPGEEGDGVGRDVSSHFLERPTDPAAWVSQTAKGHHACHAEMEPG